MRARCTTSWFVCTITSFDTIHVLLKCASGRNAFVSMLFDFESHQISTQAVAKRDETIVNVRDHQCIWAN